MGSAAGTSHCDWTGLLRGGSWAHGPLLTKGCWREMSLTVGWNKQVGGGKGLWRIKLPNQEVRQDPGKKGQAREEASEGKWSGEQSLRMASWGCWASCTAPLSLTSASMKQSLHGHMTPAVRSTGGNLQEHSGPGRCSQHRSLFPPESSPRAWRRWPSCSPGTHAPGSLTSTPRSPRPGPLGSEHPHHRLAGSQLGLSFCYMVNH